MISRSIKTLHTFMVNSGIPIDRDAMAYLNALDLAVQNLPLDKEIRTTIQNMLIETINGVREKGENATLAFSMCAAMISGAATVLTLAMQSSEEEEEEEEEEEIKEETVTES